MDIHDVKFSTVNKQGWYHYGRDAKMRWNIRKIRIMIKKLRDSVLWRGNETKLLASVRDVDST